MSFGDRVRAHRMAIGMTATALAKLSRIAGPRISRIELPGIRPSRVAIFRIGRLGHAIQIEEPA